MTEIMINFPYFFELIYRKVVTNDALINLMLAFRAQQEIGFKNDRNRTGREHGAYVSDKKMASAGKIAGRPTMSVMRTQSRLEKNDFHVWLESNSEQDDLVNIYDVIERYFNRGVNQYLGGNDDDTNNLTWQNVIAKHQKTLEKHSIASGPRAACTNKLSRGSYLALDKFLGIAKNTKREEELTQKIDRILFKREILKNATEKDIRSLKNLHKQLKDLKAWKTAVNGLIEENKFSKTQIDILKDKKLAAMNLSEIPSEFCDELWHHHKQKNYLLKTLPGHKIQTLPSEDSSGDIQAIGFGYEDWVSMKSTVYFDHDKYWTYAQHTKLSPEYDSELMLVSALLVREAISDYQYYHQRGIQCKTFTRDCVLVYNELYNSVKTHESNKDQFTKHVKKFIDEFRSPSAHDSLKALHKTHMHKYSYSLYYHSKARNLAATLFGGSNALFIGAAIAAGVALHVTAATCLLPLLVGSALLGVVVAGICAYTVLKPFFKSPNLDAEVSRHQSILQYKGYLSDDKSALEGEHIPAC